MGAMQVLWSRPGFSLVELLIAIVLLTGGLAVAAGVSMHAMRAVAAGSRRALAATLAADVVDSLAATPCAGRTSGSASSRGTSIVWTVRDSSGAKHVLQTVSFLGSRAPIAVDFETMLPC